MKKNSALILLGSLLVLASCGQNSFGAEVNGAEDFLSVVAASETGFNITKTAVVTNKSNQAPSTEFDLYNHSAELYSGDDFVYETTTVAADGTAKSEKVQGFTVVNAETSKTTYFLVNTDKGGITSQNSSLLDTYRANAKSIINSDYSAVNAAYNAMKPFAGLKAGTVEGVNYSSIYFATSVAGTTAGYTLKTVQAVEGGTRQIDRYITLDKTNDKWGFTFYAVRVTDKIGSDVIYYTQDYAFECLTDEALSSKELNAKKTVSQLTFTIDGVEPDTTSADGTPLTGK